MIDAFDRASAFTSAILQTGIQTLDEIKSGFLVVFLPTALICYGECIA